MKIKISRRTRKYLIIYIVVILILYLVIEMVPKVTDIFETTEILEPGNLQISCEAEGWFVKEEAISTAKRAGTIKYIGKEGMTVKKNYRVMKIKVTEDTSGVSRKYANLMRNLEGYDGIYRGVKTPVSGVLSFNMDGCEMVMNPSHLDSLTLKQVKDMVKESVSLTREETLKDEPIYKITSDDKWYIVCWLDKEDAENYTEDQKVRLQLPAGTVDAVVRSISPEDDKYKIIFRSNMYYSDLANSRKADMTIVNSTHFGLLINNGCIIEKHGQKGVYVRDKNGDYSFTPIQIIETDGERSVISDSQFYDAEGQTIYTVKVYDEVLKNPKGELRRDLKSEKEEKEAKAEKAEKESKDKDNDKQ